MTLEQNQFKDVMLNGIVAVRHMLRDADRRLKGMEDGLSLLGRQLLSSPGIRLITFRHEQTDEGALGRLLFDRRLFCITLEPDAGDPTRHQIPASVYPIKPFSGNKFKNTLEVIVPDHTTVLFHNGSFERHTTMCVLLGYHLTFRRDLSKAPGVAGIRFPPSVSCSWANTNPSFPET
jgi:hypothetical protein